MIHLPVYYCASLHPIISPYFCNIELPLSSIDVVAEFELQVAKDERLTTYKHIQMMEIAIVALSKVKLLGGFRHICMRFLAR